MTQEELDAMINGDINLDDGDVKPVEKIEDSASNKDDKIKYKIDSEEIADLDSWPPPPPTENHKMVNQLDDVTKDSELKATEIFDKLESINGSLMDSTQVANEISEVIDYNIDIFLRLNSEFPHVNTFQEALEKNQNIKDKIQDMVGNLEMGEDEVMMAMDIMQYQDIHRQKIERVINVMRALSKYINSLFSANKDDELRVGSASHIEGDLSTKNVVDNAEIEALIDSLGAKNK